MAHHEVRTICMRDCPDACSIIATVDQGRVIRQRGDPDHGVTRGFLCARGNAFTDPHAGDQGPRLPRDGHRRRRAGGRRLSRGGFAGW